jgi:hypothetical protein
MSLLRHAKTISSTISFMPSQKPNPQDFAYDTRLKVLFPPLAHIDVNALVGARISLAGSLARRAHLAMIEAAQEVRSSAMPKVVGS